MSEYVGLDVSLKEVSACIVDVDGAVLLHATLPTEPDGVTRFIKENAPKAERVVHESETLATWLTRELKKRGVPVICIDARKAHKALSDRLNKSDRAEAESLAQLARTGWFN